MSSKKCKTYNVSQKNKNKDKMKLDTKKMQLNLPGLNRNDGIVKTGTGRWEDKKKKNINKLHKKEMSGYKGSNSNISFFYAKNWYIM